MNRVINILTSIKNRDKVSLYTYKSKLIRIFSPRYGLSPDDIILATFPKSGTTWIRFIFANIISLVELNGRTVDYKLLNEKLNTAFDPNWKPEIKYTCLPLIRPTHKFYRKKYFGKNKSIYLFRNPKDVMVSAYNYRKSFVNDPFNGTFKDILKDERYGLESWCKHVNSWLTNATITLSYESMKENPYGKIKLLLEELELDHFSDDIVNEAIERSNFKSIKKIEKERGLDKTAEKRLNKNFNFARKGEVGEGKNYFDDEDNEFFEKMLKRYSLLEFYKKNYAN